MARTTINRDLRRLWGAFRAPQIPDPIEVAPVVVPTYDAGRGLLPWFSTSQTLGAVPAEQGEVVLVVPAGTTLLDFDWRVTMQAGNPVVVWGVGSPESLPAWDFLNGGTTAAAIVAPASWSGRERQSQTTLYWHSGPSPFTTSMNEPTQVMTNGTGTIVTVGFQWPQVGLDVVGPAVFSANVGGANVEFDAHLRWRELQDPA